ERDDPRRVTSNLGQKAETVGAASLLPARRERPCSRTADERDELASPHGPCLSARATRYQIKQCCAAQQNWVPMTASGQSRLMQCETTNGLFPLFPKPGRKTSTSTRLACTRANVAGLSSARLYLGFPPERHSHTVVMSEERLVVANGTSFKTEGHD